MTVWILGHDRRFAAAFSARGVYNLISFHGTTDFNYYWDHEFGGTPWESFEAHWNHSPLAYVKNIHTPLVIKHSDLDYRVPINDAEQLFVALRKLKRTVQFVRYPREGHELSRSGERCVCELTEMIGVEMPTVSRHLSVLKGAGILEDDKRGAQVFYRLRTPCVMNFFRCVTEVRQAAVRRETALLG